MEQQQFYFGGPFWRGPFPRGPFFRRPFYPRWGFPFYFNPYLGFPYYRFPPFFGGPGFFEADAVADDIVTAEENQEVLGQLNTIGSMVFDIYRLISENQEFKEENLEGENPGEEVTE